jgi:CRISPR-associated endonuclease/helicase Cas3
MTLFAHSPNPQKGIPAQDYATHVGGVVERASVEAEQVSCYSIHDGDLLKEVVRLSAMFHDLGKIDGQNQDVLSGKRKAKKLPVQHTDAGTAYLLNDLNVPAGAVLVRSHHIGMPDFVEEQNRGEMFFRDEVVFDKVNQTLSELVESHEKIFHNPYQAGKRQLSITGTASLFFRIALSCLADGDHTDTAVHYGDQTPFESIIKLRPMERLDSLNRFVETLKEDNARSRMRSEVYTACRDFVITSGIASCDSPVGTGKTTAVMAHLLMQAEKRGLRRIIVVLPFTNIIRQSVEVYRTALTLSGEDPEQVVAELHHRADFQDIQSRQFTALWKAPIIVTTAVSFFETLASNTPATLRRLHNLPGSAVFVDESHAALPARLLPLAWEWIKAFAREWGCYWVMASGSLNRFWEIKEFDKESDVVPEIMPTDLRIRLADSEKGRIKYQFIEKPLGTNDLVDWVASLPGPRIIILNTVQSAAVVAHEYEKRFQRPSVEHISTALTPGDRDITLNRIKTRLKDINDTDWSLIATSCVEAGVDLSFKTGIREAASLVSLLQTGGRVNRHNYFSAENIWTIKLKEEGLLKKHPGMNDSARVLLDLISEGRKILADLCTEALKREIRLAGNFSDSLLKLERELRFPQVEKEFKVIASDTRTVIVGNELVEKLENHIQVNWREIQKSSVQIWGYRLDHLRIPEVLGHPGIHKWIYPYNDFIGYMAGIIPITSDAWII